MSSNLLRQKFMSHGGDNKILLERKQKVQAGYNNHPERDLLVLNESNIL